MLTAGQLIVFGGQRVGGQPVTVGGLSMAAERSWAMVVGQSIVVGRQSMLSTAAFVCHRLPRQSMYPHGTAGIPPAGLCGLVGCRGKADQSMGVVPTRQRLPFAADSPAPSRPPSLPVLPALSLDD